MTSFVQLGITTILAFTIITCTALVMTTKERINTRRQDDWLTIQRESIAAGARANRDISRLLTPPNQDDK